MDSVNQQELRKKVKLMYKEVAENPKENFHFEIGRPLAEKLGYPSLELNKIPKESIDSFAGVGYHFDLADIKENKIILDLGSGSGMDSFFASLKTGKNGKVIGIDMTEEQLKKAKNLSKNFKNVEFKKAFVEKLPFKDETFDVVISNGVINLCPNKTLAFKEISRVLKKNGRLAISDIVTEKQLTEGITCNANLWASCIGGAEQQDKYKKAIESGKMKIMKIKENSQYKFLSKSALGSTKDFGVKSISLLAKKI